MARFGRREEGEADDDVGQVQRCASASDYQRLKLYDLQVLRTNGQGGVVVRCFVCFFFFSEGVRVSVDM